MPSELTPNLDNNSEGWQQCPPGALHQYALQTKRQIRAAVCCKFFLTIAFLLVAACGAYMLGVPRPAPPRSHATTEIILPQMMLRCHEIHANIDGYISKQVDASERRLMEEHFARCPNCFQRMRELSPKALQAQK